MNTKQKIQLLENLTGKKVILKENVEPDECYMVTGFTARGEAFLSKIEKVNVNLDKESIITFLGYLEEEEDLEYEDVTYEQSSRSGITYLGLIPNGEWYLFGKLGSDVNFDKVVLNKNEEALNTLFGILDNENF